MASAAANPLSIALIALLRGVTERDADPVLWQSIMELQARVRDQVTLLGLDLVLDEAEGYAYLRQRPTQRLSAGRQFHAGSDANHQGIAEHVAQPLQRVARGRLRQADPHRGAADIGLH